MSAPVLCRDDLVALSFISRLPREVLYPALRGESPADEPCLPFDRPPADVPAASVSDPLVALLMKIQQVDLGPRHRPDRRDPALLADAARQHARGAIENAAARGIEVLVWGDDAYPPLLSEIFDPPLVLWVRGSIDLLSTLAIAVVGSRAASSYGEDTAARLGHDIASAGITVVSGLARGIDGAAHRGALEAGRTVAVLGCGPDIVYPGEHRELMDEVLRNGTVASEYPPGTTPAPQRFPRRNRIISGLARAVVVVEAWRRSGALITANCALEQGREVMAVPGNVLSERHRGSHMLIKCGAALIETAADVFDVLKLACGVSMQAGLSDRDPIVAALDGDGLDLDMLAAKCRSDAAALLPRLLELELQGRIRRLPGGRFVAVLRAEAGNVLT